MPCSPPSSFSTLVFVFDFTPWVHWTGKISFCCLKIHVHLLHDSDSRFLMNWQMQMVFLSWQRKTGDLASSRLSHCAGSHKYCGVFWCNSGQFAFPLTQYIWRMRGDEDIACCYVVLHWNSVALNPSKVLSLVAYLWALSCLSYFQKHSFICAPLNLV